MQRTIQPEKNVANSHYHRRKAKKFNIVLDSSWDINLEKNPFKALFLIEVNVTLEELESRHL